MQLQLGERCLHSFVGVLGQQLEGCLAAAVTACLGIFHGPLHLA
jgi:hypothetical protein